MAQPVGTVEAAASAAPPLMTPRRETRRLVAAVIAVLPEFARDDIADRNGLGYDEALFDALDAVRMAAGCLRIGRKAAQDAAPEGYGALVVGELFQPPGPREAGQQLACEGEADATSAPPVDDEKLCNLMAALACVEPHQGEAGDLAADLGPPCRAPFSLAPVGVEAVVGKYAVDRLRAGIS